MRRLTPLLPLAAALLLVPCFFAFGEDAAKPAPALVKLVPLNLALNKTATASGSEGDKPPAMAVDGDPATRWCAADGKTGYWWQVDLGKPEEITSCRIAWEFDGAKYKYKVEGSPDEKTWQTLADHTGDNAPTTREQTSKFDAKDVRYVRVTVTGLDVNRFASFTEFEVYGRAMIEAEKVVINRTPSLLSEIKVPQGMKATIFAAPPQVAYPVALAAAPNGDVFVAVDPNGSLDQKTGRGKIIRCRDTDDDGVADQFVTFASLDSPRGLVWNPATSTMYVQHPPFVRAYHDDDGDGVADRDEVLVTGIGFDLNFRGADHTTNQMQAGIDGWLYIAVGDYGFVKATGKDGKSLQLHGGGVVRVRPDGTQLEIVSRGQRNIYDVAISPTLDLFTRDNTNDGDGWDVRLSHVIPGGQYGYPLLFKNFADEIVQPLGTYGGGSPTGALFLDEPVLPPGIGYGLYTCDWGTNAIYRHPLTPNGAGYTVEQKPFIEMPRPVDMEVDGRSRLYVASWRGGGFAYTDGNVGYVARVVNEARARQPMRDLSKATDEQLLQQIAAGDSQIRRLNAQREILKRGNIKAFAEGLRQIAANKGQLQPRVAALFTLAQLDPEGARASLGRISSDATMREFALRALADMPRVENATKTNVQPFLAALKNPDARVRLQAANGLARHGTAAIAGDALIPLMGDPDPLVSHAAVNALVTLNASDACFKVLDSTDRTLLPQALRVLQSLRDEKTVTGLMDRYRRSRDPSLYRPILKALCRLAYREAEWTSGWWGTRPDTSGPYFSPAPWEQTENVIQFLRTALLSAEGETLPTILYELLRHKVEIKETPQMLFGVARNDPAFQAKAVELLMTRPSLSLEILPALADAAASPRQSPALRARALEALVRAGQPEAVYTALKVFATLGADAPEELSRARTVFLHDGSHYGRVPLLETIATTDTEAARRELAFGVLLQVTASKQAAPESAAGAAKVIENAWAKPDTTVSLLRAIGREKLTAYTAQARARLEDADANVRIAAAYAILQLGGDPSTRPTTQPATTRSTTQPAAALIADLPYEQTLAIATKTPGDAKLGADLFIKQGCIACHTVSKNEPPKGPFLGGIGQRYSRAELIESIVNPNAKITQGFVTHYFITKNKDRTDGFVVREAGEEVEVRTANGTSVTIKNADVAKKGTLPTSIMPEGLVGTLSPEELGSMLAYLESLKSE